jgi:hypothetical protein
LEAVTPFGLTTNNIQHLINEFSALGVMTFRPVITGAGLSKDEVVRSKEIPKGTGTNSVHGTRFQIDQHSTRNVFVSGSLIKGW